MARITRPQVMIIGGVLALLIGIGFFFGLIKPLNEAKAEAETKYNTQKAIADQRAAAMKKKADNQRIVDKAKRDWSVYDNQLMTYTGKDHRKHPVVDTSNLFTAMQQRWDEQTVRLGPLVKYFLEKDKSVRIVQANLAVQAPPSDPNAANTKVIELPLGTVTVAGTFENILRHVDRWNKFNRLVVVDDLALQGNSPQLVGSYKITCYIFTHSDKTGDPVPQAGSGGAGGGGGFGGPGGGFGGGGYPGAGGAVTPRGGSGGPKGGGSAVQE